MLAAIVFTDLGEQARTDIDEDGAIAMLRYDADLLERLCYEFNGQYLGSKSSGVAMLFTSAVHAIGYALEAQRLLRTPARLGLHLGEVKLGDRDAIFQEVEAAQELSASRAEGQICMSRAFHQVVRQRLSSDGLRVRRLKKKDDSRVVLTAPADHKVKAKHRPAPRLRLSNAMLVGASVALLAAGAAELQSAQTPQDNAVALADAEQGAAPVNVVLYGPAPRLQQLGMGPGKHFFVHIQHPPI